MKIERSVNFSQREPQKSLYYLVTVRNLFRDISISIVYKAKKTLQRLLGSTKDEV